MWAFFSKLFPINQRLLQQFERSYYRTQPIFRALPERSRWLLLFSIVSLLFIAEPSKPFFKITFFLLFSLYLFSFSFLTFCRWRLKKSLSWARECPARIYENQTFQYQVKLTYNLPVTLWVKDTTALLPPSVLKLRLIPKSFLNTLGNFDRTVGYPQWFYIHERSFSGYFAPFFSQPHDTKDFLSHSAKGVFFHRGSQQWLGTYFSFFDPLGLLRTVAYCTGKQSVLVLPTPADYSQLHFSSYTLGGFGSSEARTQDASDDFFSLSEWRNGDSLQKIDWKASAKHQHLLKKEHISSGAQKTQLIVDPRGVPESKSTESEENMVLYCHYEALIRAASAIIHNPTLFHTSLDIEDIVFLDADGSTRTFSLKHQSDSALEYLAQYVAPESPEIEIEQIQDKLLSSMTIRRSLWLSFIPEETELLSLVRVCNPSILEAFPEVSYFQRQTPNTCQSNVTWNIPWDPIQSI